MTGYSDAYTPSSIADAAHMASDIEDDQSGLISGVSAFNTIAVLLIAALAVFLTAELAWRGRRQHRRKERAEPTREPDSHESEISP